MMRTRIYTALTMGLLVLQTGCLEVTYSDAPADEYGAQTGTYEDVAINPQTSPYYTEPVLPDPPIDLSSVGLASITLDESAERPAPIGDYSTGVEAKTISAAMSLKDVVGAGINMSSTGEKQLLVLAKDDAASQSVPKQINGIATHVDVVGVIKATGYNTRSKYRPVVPSGVSVGNGWENSSGTIGAVVMKNGIRYMLSNNHVLARENRARIGEQIVQPGRADTRGIPTETVAILSAFKPVSFTQYNNFDAAIARYTGYHSYSMVQQAFSPSQITATAHAGQSVMKMGRTTGLTYGTVQSTNVTIKVDFNGQNAVFADQIYIKGDVGDFLQAGDSGSLLVTGDGAAHPVGLLFAGGEGSAFANPIQPILDYFGVTIAGK